MDEQEQEEWERVVKVEDDGYEDDREKENAREKEEEEEEG